MISHSGSLATLSKYPASTIQILGAEKALFRALKKKTKTPKYGLLYNTSFIGRAIGTYLLRFINSGKLLFQFAIMAGVCVLATVFIEGIVGLYALVGISFFMSLMFPTIYGIALEEVGEDTTLGAAGLVMAIVGGAALLIWHSLFCQPKNQAEKG